MIIKTSRERYGRPREVVEKEIIRWSSGLSETEEEGTETGSVRVTGADGKAEQFVSICSVCGKEAKTPFKPNPNRPVYCSDCLEKLKAGTIKPPKIIKKPSIEKQAKAEEILAGMGIEFSETPQAGSGRSRQLPMRKEGKAPMVPAQQGEVSLSNLRLAPRRDDKPKRDVDPNKLKEELRRTLGAE